MMDGLTVLKHAPNPKKTAIKYGTGGYCMTRRDSMERRNTAPPKRMPARTPNLSKIYPRIIFPGTAISRYREEMDAAFSMV